MAESFPTREPETFRQGDTVKWAKTVTHLGESRTPGDSWVLTYTLAKENYTATITSTTDHGGGAFEVVVAATATADYEPGVYVWVAVVSKAAEVFTVDEGRLEVVPGLAQYSRGLEGRSWAERTLEAVEALIEGRADFDQDSYSIAGRSLTLMNISELMDWQARLRRRVASEERKRRVESGRDPGSTVRLRM